MGAKAKRAVSKGRVGLVLGAAVMLAAGGVVAQPSSPPSETPAPPGPPPPSAPTPPEKIAPLDPPVRGAPPGGSGSGVIQPSGNVDPGIQTEVPVPHPNSMPVIPPPGMPGGNPTVQPK